MQVLTGEVLGSLAFLGELLSCLHLTLVWADAPCATASRWGYRCCLRYQGRHMSVTLTARVSRPSVTERRLVSGEITRQI